MIGEQEERAMIELGDLAKDVITGFEGVVTATATHLHNCDRALLAPRELKDGKPIEPGWFDMPQLELVTKSVVPATKPEPGQIKLGDLVRDTMTPFRGQVTAINYWINGCARIGIQGNELKDGLPVAWEWLPPGQLEVIGPKTAEVKAVRTGGPMPTPRGVQTPK